MRLLSLELIGQYKGLKDQYFDFRNTEGNILALIGLNGSGKSQLLELLAETFAYLERWQREDFKRRNWFNFEVKLVYSISEIDGELECHEYTVWIDIHGNVRWNTNAFKELNELPLPSHIIGYSSGLNENLQRAFMKNAVQYMDVMNTKRRFEEKITDIQLYRSVFESDHPDGFFDKKIEDIYTYYKVRYSGVFPEIDDIKVSDSMSLGLRATPVPIMKYLDHDSTCLLLASLGILTIKEQAKIFNKKQRFKNISSVQFEYDLRKFKYDPGALLDIQKLIQCIGGVDSAFFISLSDRTSDDFYNQFELDYLRGEIYLNFHDPILQRKLKEIFFEPKIFFEKLYRLQLLGAEFWPSEMKKELRSDKFDKSIKKPQKWTAPIKINSLQLTDERGQIIAFEDLSDGEAQLIQILAMSAIFKESRVLFLLDEPETHLNPAWRTYFHSYLEEIINTPKNDANPWLQYFISTHSPFMISSLKKENVLFFKRNHNGLIDLEPVAEETYGASFDVIIKSFFELKTLISQTVVDDINQRLNLSRNLEGENSLMDWINKELGDSMEKAYLLKKLEN